MLADLQLGATILARIAAISFLGQVANAASWPPTLHVLGALALYPILLRLCALHASSAKICRYGRLSIERSRAQPGSARGQLGLADHDGASRSGLYAASPPKAGGSKMTPIRILRRTFSAHCYLLLAAHHPPVPLILRTVQCFVCIVQHRDWTMLLTRKYLLRARQNPACQSSLPNHRLHHWIHFTAVISHRYRPQHHYLPSWERQPHHRPMSKNKSIPGRHPSLLHRPFGEHSTLWCKSSMRSSERACVRMYYKLGRKHCFGNFDFAHIPIASDVLSTIYIVRLKHCRISAHFL